MRIYLLWMTGFLGSWFVVCVPSVLALQEHWAETAMAAKAALESQRYDQAQILYFQALKEAETFGEDDPRLTATLRDTADCLTQHSKNYVLAEQLLKREQRILRRLGSDFPGLVAGMDLLGRLYYKQGNYKDAEKMFQDALTLSPESGAGGGATNRDWRQEMLPRLGLCYQRDGKYDQAERCLRSALAAAEAKNEGVAGLYYPCRNLASLYYDMHRYDNSIFYFKRCLALSERNPNWEGYNDAESQALMRIGEIYSAQKKDKEALNCFRQASVFARRDPNCAETLLHTLYPSLAKQELGAGNYSESRSAASEALTIAQRRRETALVKQISNFLATNNPSH
jgi:tetratricopeptide (TPR) repeat protein